MQDTRRRLDSRACCPPVRFSSGQWWPCSLPSRSLLKGGAVLLQRRLLMAGTPMQPVLRARTPAGSKGLRSAEQHARMESASGESQAPRHRERAAVADIGLPLERQPGGQGFVGSNRCSESSQSPPTPGGSYQDAHVGQDSLPLGVGPARWWSARPPHRRCRRRPAPARPAGCERWMSSWESSLYELA